MAQERAVFWLAVVALLGVGLMLGQFPAVMIGAMAAIALAHQNDRISFGRGKRDPGSPGA
jgi:hypothetical protein